jgi:dTDP-4-dehydrorhamnose reductase
MLRLAERGGRVRVVDDQHCTPSYAVHVARAIRFLIEQRATGVYHVVNRGETTWFEFAQTILRLAGVEGRIDPISTQEYAARAPRPAFSVLDTAKYHATGGPLMPTWQEALEEYLAARHRA